MMLFFNGGRVPPLKKRIQARNVWKNSIIIKTFQCAELKANGHDSFTQYLHISLPCDSWELNRE